jgi:hypothetical protein
MIGDASPVSGLPFPGSSSHVTGAWRGRGIIASLFPFLLF